MEGVKRTNVVIANFQQRAEFLPRSSYAMDVDRSWNRNCYTCGCFRHLAKNCRNQNIEMNKRMEIENSNLKEEQDLIVFD